MTNVANLENSKRLFELSGWDDEELERFDHHQEGGSSQIDNIPKYDCGYLLRKLLPHTRVEFILQSDGKTLLVHYPEPLQEEYIFADTPENALCELAIKLFESNILTREEV